MSKIKQIGWVILMMFLVQGCTDIAISGAQAVYNRHSIQKNINENYSTLYSLGMVFAIV